MVAAWEGIIEISKTHPLPFLRQITVGVCYFLSPIKQPNDSCWNSDPTTFIQTSLPAVSPERDLLSSFDIAFACSTPEMSLHQLAPHCRLVRLIQSSVSALTRFFNPWSPNDRCAMATTLQVHTTVRCKGFAIAYTETVLWRLQIARRKE